MNLIQAIILGIVEGLTEFLPVSSTGHLILFSSLLHIAQTDFVKSFEIIIQLGAILAVVVLYWRSFLDLEIIKKLIVAFLPTAVLGLLLYKIVKHYLLGNNQIVLWALLLGGLLLIAFEKWRRSPIQVSDDVRRISYKQALLVGLFQSIAIIPGVSRSAATILGGLWLGIRRRTIVEFSFLLAVPTMLAATGLDVLKSYKDILSGPKSALALGFIVSFLVAMAAIKYFLRFIRSHSLATFGFYRIVAAILFWVIIL